MREHEAQAALALLVFRAAPQSQDTPALALPLHDAHTTITFD